MRRPPVARWRRAVDWVVGLTLIFLGLLGGLVPVLQGWVFVLAGLAVLSSHSRWARELLERLKLLWRRVRARATGRSVGDR